MSADLDLTTAEWIRSSYSDANGGQCVEFSRVFTQTHGTVPVRDSKHPHGPALIFPVAGLVVVRLRPHTRRVSCELTLPLLLRRLRNQKLSAYPCGIGIGVR